MFIICFEFMFMVIRDHGACNSAEISETQLVGSVRDHVSLKTYIGLVTPFHSTHTTPQHVYTPQNSKALFS